ncbi:MAG: 30S ribosomal protein S9 [Candidatus Komeilibacteria bacterium]|nr:30S ribosomal protein S9 [Candidatus Komeilibacteria bacterium]
MPKINSSLDYHQAVGRRKSATAIVRLYPKDDRGVILINNKPLDEYFHHFELQKIVTEALETAGLLGRHTISIKTIGGGKKGQAEAARHGLTRLMIQLDENLKPALKAQGFLTRDPRVKERKKPGLKRARKAPQWSKR